MKNLLIVYSMHTHSKHILYRKVYYDCVVERLCLKFKARNHWFIFDTGSVLVSMNNSLKILI